MKKSFVILALTILTIGIISSCQKEKMTVDTNAPEMVQKDLKSLEDIKTNALQYKALAEKNQQKTDAELQVLKQKIETLKAERSQRFGNQDVSSRSVNGIIRVPQDYPSLQLAVDNSTSGGKIFIQGTVSEPSDVLVDVPGLTIQGQGSSPTVNGSTLMISAGGVTVQNLNVNMATVISGINNAKLMNCTISATNNTGAIGVLLVMNSSNNSIKNCTIDGAYAGGSHEYGLFLDNLSNQNEVENSTSKNTFGPTGGGSNSSAFRIDGADNSIKNCTALNFTRGFSSFGGACINNQFKGCVANSSVNDAGFVFFLPTQSNLTLENCTANSSTNGFFIFGGSGVVSKCTANSNLSLGALIIFTDVLVEKSTFNNNGGLGIYLYAVNNSTIEKNNSNGNPICDFNETFCSGNTVSDNNFGTICTGL